MLETERERDGESERGRRARELEGAAFVNIVLDDVSHFALGVPSSLDKQ